MSARRPSIKDRLARDSFFQTSADLPRLVELDVAGIAPNPEQPRLMVDPEMLEGLRLSIERQGLLQPILVRECAEGWILVAGQRRLAAVRSLGRTTIAAIVTTGDPLEIALVENLQRAELDPFDEAGALRRLLDKHGWTQAQLGEALGRKQSTVSQTLALERLPSRIRTEYPTSDKVSRSLLVELAQIGDEEAQLRLWDVARSGRLTVREVRQRRQVVPRDSGMEEQGRSSVDGSLRRLLAAGERLARELESDRPLPDPGVLAERLRSLHVFLGRLLESYQEPTGPTHPPRHKGR